MIKGLVIPSMVDGNTWAGCFGLSWADLLTRDQAITQCMVREGGKYLRKVSGTMGVAEARNEIVKAFLETTDGEWLWMVDTDMGFTADTVDRMVASAETHRVDVLGALCFALKSDGRPENEFHAMRSKIVPTLYRFVDTGKEKGFLPISQYERNAFQYADGTGAACLLMHRRALEKIGPAPFRPMVVAGANPDGTDRAFSEDLSFCARAAGAEIPIGVDTSIKTTHYKTAMYLDEETYLAQQAVATRSPLGVEPNPPMQPEREVMDIAAGMRRAMGVA